jgi:hypothetical protein
VGNVSAPRELVGWRWLDDLETDYARTRRVNLISRRDSLESIPAMILIRLAISIFALTLIGTAFSLNVVQNEQNSTPESAMITRQ